MTPRTDEPGGGLEPLTHGQLAPVTRGRESREPTPDERREIEARAEELRRRLPDRVTGYPGTPEALANYKPGWNRTRSDLDTLTIDYEQRAIPKAVSIRLCLQKQERRSKPTRTITPSWSDDRAIPGVLVVLHWDSGDAFGCSRVNAELDTAFRRANALMEKLKAGEEVTTWPMPTRPSRAGLWLMDARYGSLDTLWIVYGALVTAATSAPVSLASFAALAWSASKSAARITGRWRVRYLSRGEIERERPGPTLRSRLPEEAIGTWQERTTKSLMPAIELAVSNGTGLNFSAVGPGGEVRLIVPPNSAEPRR